MKCATCACHSRARGFVVISCAWQGPSSSAFEFVRRAHPIEGMAMAAERAPPPKRALCKNTPQRCPQSATRDPPTPPAASNSFPLVSSTAAAVKQQPPQLNLQWVSVRRARWRRVVCLGRPLNAPSLPPLRCWRDGPPQTSRATRRPSNAMQKQAREQRGQSEQRGHEA